MQVLLYLPLSLIYGTSTMPTIKIYATVQGPTPTYVPGKIFTLSKVLFLI